jgi:transposase-like protein
MEKRRRKTKEEKQSLVNNYLESGLSKKAWCENNNIPVSTLVGWEKQLKKAKKDDIIFVSPKSSQANEKIRSSIKADKASDKGAAVFTTILEIEDCKLHINENTPIPFIGQIIKVVRESYV